MSLLCPDRRPSRAAGRSTGDQADRSAHEAQGIPARPDFPCPCACAGHGASAPYDLLNPEQALYTAGERGKIEPVGDGGFENAGTVRTLKERAARVK
ncbi:hypothetical protein ACFV8E_05550 [Streptomyces sp. NPDC059849]|uniref:hypothetical protein n=1 Tax=unclassified Streptomyces TaxID=2593676 RepID=UPI00365E55B2